MTKGYSSWKASFRNKVTVDLRIDINCIDEAFAEYHGAIYKNLLTTHRKFGKFVVEIQTKRDNGLAEAN